MNTAVLLTVTMSAQLFGCVIKKYYSDRFQTGKMRHLYNAAVSLFAAVILFFWGGIGETSIFTLVLGVAFGIITALQQIFNLKAIEIGPLSYTSVIVSMSTLIPTLSGLIFWNESVGIAQIIGIILMVICFFLSVNTNGNEKKSSLRWLMYCAITFVCTGAIGVMQKVHQSSNYRHELNSFLLLSFVVSFLYSLINIIWLKSKKDVEYQNKTDILFNKKLILTAILVLSGVCVAVQNKLNLFLAGVMDSAVFFPLVNGGGLVLSTVASVLFFKEKLNVKQWIGVITGIVSVILLCNPFG